MPMRGGPFPRSLTPRYCNMLCTTTILRINFDQGESRDNHQSPTPRRRPLRRPRLLVLSSSRPSLFLLFSFSISLVFYRLAWLLAVGVPLTGKVLPLPLVLLALLSVCFFDWGGAGVASTLAGATGGWCGLYLASGVATLSWLLVLLPQLGQGWCCFNLAGFASVRLGFFFASTGLFFCSLASTGFSLSLRLGFLFRFDWAYFLLLQLGFSFASTGLFFCFSWAFSFASTGPRFD